MVVSLQLQCANMMPTEKENSKLNYKNISFVFDKKLNNYHLPCMWEQ